jgi:hypothetical protein
LRVARRNPCTLALRSYAPRGCRPICVRTTLGICLRVGRRCSSRVHWAVLSQNGRIGPGSGSTTTPGFRCGGRTRLHQSWTASGLAVESCSADWMYRNSPLRQSDIDDLRVSRVVAVSNDEACHGSVNSACFLSAPNVSVSMTSPFSVCVWFSRACRTSTNVTPITAGSCPGTDPYCHNAIRTLGRERRSGHGHAVSLRCGDVIRDGPPVSRAGAARVDDQHDCRCLVRFAFVFGRSVVNALPNLRERVHGLAGRSRQQSTRRWL